MEKQKLIFITAPWCATCKQVKPLAQKLCEAADTEMVVLDMIENEAECLQYNPTSLPFLVYGDNAVCGSACNRSAIEALIKA